MSSFSVDIKNLPQVKRAFKEVPQKAEKAVKKALATYGTNIVTTAKQLVPVDEGHLRNSISYKIDGTTLEIIVATDYAAYMEFGTRKFAQTYVSTLPKEWQELAALFKGGGGGSLTEMLVRLQAWVMRKGFAAQKTKSGNISKSQSSLKAQEQAAYQIAIQILLNGVKPHPFLKPAVDNNRAFFVVDLRAELDAILK